MKEPPREMPRKDDEPGEDTGASDSRKQDYSKNKGMPTKGRKVDPKKLAQALMKRKPADAEMKGEGDGGKQRETEERGSMGY